MLSEARILRAFENLEVGFSNLAKNMKINDEFQDNDYLQIVVFEEIKKLQNLIKACRVEEKQIMKSKMRTLSITKIFEKCLDCPLHKSEQMNGEFCYNERPYREIVDSDIKPFPKWCKAEILGKENE